MNTMLVAVLGAEPSMILQAGAVRVHMQVLEVEHDLVEDVSVLNRRRSSESL